MKNYKHVIYILTNPLYAGYVKIGYASDLNARLASLNTGMLRNFEAYAVYETNVKNADKSFHAIIDDLAPIVRTRVINGQKVQDKEFFKLEPEQAYDILQHIADMTGTRHKLHRQGEDIDKLPSVSPYVQQSSSSLSVSKSVSQSIRIPSTPVPSSNPNNSRPISCSIADQTHPFQSYRNTLIWQCNTLIDLVGFDEFCSVVLNAPKLQGKKRGLFSRNESDMAGLGHYNFSQGQLTLNTNFCAKDTQKKITLLNELFDYPLVWIRE